MNAHDRLRLYLEQRRELGESELVLDGLPVDAVLKMIGAPGGKGAAPRAPASTASSPDASTAPAEKRARPIDDAGATNSNDAPPMVDAPSSASSVAPTDPAPRFDSAATTDWRAALRDLAPGAEQKSATRANSDVPPAVPAKVDIPKTAATKSDIASGDTADVDTSAANVSAKSTDVTTGSGAPPRIIAPPDDFPAWLANLGLPVGLSSNAPGEAVTSAAANACNTLDELARTISACRACSLGASAINAVPGEGNPNADFVCVGEAPGQTEDETGRPFIGASGDLLTKILIAIQLPREEVFICNVVKHRPPANRNPTLDEVRACTPYLTRQLALVQPKVILALGVFAAQTLLNTTSTIAKLRGQIHRYQGVPLIVTYHPSALLRNDALKRPAWADVKLARKILDASRANAAGV